MSVAAVVRVAAAVLIGVKREDSENVWWREGEEHRDFVKLPLRV